MDLIKSQHLSNSCLVKLARDEIWTLLINIALNFYNQTKFDVDGGNTSVLYAK
jgi:hypothetical protein